MSNELAKTTAKLGFGRTPKFKTADQLVERLERIDQIEQVCKAACDYQRGKEIAAAKAELEHGEYLKALEAKGMSNQKAGELRRWYEACQSPEFSEFDPAQAEQKLSQGARTEFCRADDQVKAVVAVAVSDDETSKITAKQIKSLATADLPPSINDITVEKVRELINHEEYTIDTTSLTNQEKDECLLEQNTRIEALTSMYGLYNMQTQPYFGGIDSDGRFAFYEWLTIIQNVSKELTSSERIKAIKHLMSELSNAERQNLINQIIQPIQQ